MGSYQGAANIEPYRCYYNGKHTSRVIGGHLFEYKRSMEFRELKSSHIRRVISYCCRVIKSCRFVYTTDITVKAINKLMHDFHRSGKSARTVNSYLADIKSFCSWLVETGVLANNPISNVKAFNASADKRHIRRALTEDEIEKLIHHTLLGEKHHGLTGYERSLVYRLALETGLRWNEIRTLNRGDFNLSAPFSVTVRAANAKNGREENLPLREALATDINNYFNDNLALPTAKAFAGMWVSRGFEMLNMDLEAAGIERENHIGIVDFHSLRHTFGTMLAKAGVAPKVAMDLMRHSDVNLTMQLYSHTVLQDRASALEKIPDIAINKQNDRATGTE